MIARLTKRTVDALRVPAGKDRAKLYDDLLTGFGVVAWPSGRKSFFVEYGPRGRQRRMSLGDYGPLTVDAARALATERLAEVLKGGDPLADREARRQLPTWGAWTAEYVEGCKRRKKRPEVDAHYLTPAAPTKKRGRKTGGHPAAVVAARWGPLPLDAITRSDVEAGLAEVSARGNTTANRWLASVRACFSEARRRGLIATNPAAEIAPYREAPPRARVLSDDEYARVVDALADLADPHVRLAFAVLMDTGARKSEVLNARWIDFDLDGGLWRLPSTKSGRPQVVPLAPETVELLRAAERLGPFLVPGLNPDRPRSDLRGAWKQVREAAGLSDVTIHDLRRTFGLHVARKAGLHIASKLLRHSDIRVTERVYAPLGLDEMREAVADTLRGRGRILELRRGGKG